MIQSHLIANKKSTPIYNGPSADAIPVATVAEGSWLGVIEKRGDCIHVVGIEAEGWVKEEDTTILPPMGLHIIWSPGKPIAYVHTAKAGC